MRPLALPCVPGAQNIELALKKVTDLFTPLITKIELTIESIESGTSRRCSTYETR